MSELDELVESLLWEGYALYPYTPGATKNSTPTPFGIVYPPAYAERNPAAYDHLRVECALVGQPTELSATVRFLQSSGERHEAVERRLELTGTGEAVPFAFDGVEGRARLRVDPAKEGGEWRVRVCVHNSTAFEGADHAGRSEALRASLLSTHVVLRAGSGRFLSATERPELESVNTWPVLATPEDDTVVSAAIVLTDHPRIAEQSRGGLFDSTEIEEALLLHVHALSDGEREAIAADDPAVRAMVERAAASTPQDIFDLHGVMRPSDEIARNGVSEAMFPPELRTPPDPDAPVRSRDQREPPIPPAALPELTGEEEVTTADGTFRKGGKVRLRPRRGGSDPFDVAAAGRIATIERLLYDVDDRLQFAVTLDDDPGQELLRDTGRFLYYFEGEVEPA